jgi:protease I
MKSLIITWSGFQDQEVIYPYYRMREESENEADVVIMSDVVGKFFGILGSNMNSNYNCEILNSEIEFYNFLNNYDLLIIPGGVKALEKLRQQKQVLNFINKWDEKGKIIASTCHGAQLLISAKVVKGRKISAYYSIEDDVNNAGAVYINKPVVIDGNIVSSPHYNWMGEWMCEAIKEAKKNVNS